MAEALKEPFCPLYNYEKLLVEKPWNKSLDANQGLLFDKFAYAWRTDEKTAYAFDKGVGKNKEGAGKWLKEIAARKSVAAALLQEACQRQREMVQRLGGRILLLKNTSRFATGLGREHPLENGFTWHQTLGVPYLNGSSLKGMLRAWFREVDGELLADRQGKPKWKESSQTEDLFGSQNAVGQFILLDMIPTSSPQLAVDIMTPHYSPYYQDDRGDTAPGDWHSPVPISFLTVEVGTSWQVAILPGPEQRTVSDEQLSKLHAALIDAFAWLGAGAKTAAGYGRFERDTEGEKRLREQEEQIRREQATEAKRKAEEAEFQKSLESASPELQRLKTLQREHSWRPEAGDQTMIQDLETFTEQCSNPPDDCLAFIQQWLESIPGYKGVWENPDATRGKKNKPEYGSKRIRGLVHRLRPDREA